MCAGEQRPETKGKKKKQPTPWVLKGHERKGWKIGHHKKYARYCLLKCIISRVKGK